MDNNKGIRVETGEGGREGWGGGEGWRKRQKTILEQQFKKSTKNKKNNKIL